MCEQPASTSLTSLIQTLTLPTDHALRNVVQYANCHSMDADHQVTGVRLPGNAGARLKSCSSVARQAIQAPRAATYSAAGRTVELRQVLLDLASQDLRPDLKGAGAKRLAPEAVTSAAVPGKVKQRRKLPIDIATTHIIESHHQKPSVVVGQGFTTGPGGTPQNCQTARSAADLLVPKSSKWYNQTYMGSPAALEPSVAIEMLQDEAFQPGARLRVLSFGRVQWIYKELTYLRKNQRGSRSANATPSDRWYVMAVWISDLDLSACIAGIIAGAPKPPACIQFMHPWSPEGEMLH